MNKYKVHISPFNLLTDTQAEVVKLQTMAQGLTGVVAGSTYLNSNADNALIVGVLGYILNVVLGCLYFEKNEVEKKD